MNTLFQESLCSALAALLVCAAPRCEAIPTTTVVIAGIVKSKVPDKPPEPPQLGVPFRSGLAPEAE